MLDAGYWILDAGYLILDIGYSITYLASSFRHPAPIIHIGMAASAKKGRYNTICMLWLLLGFIRLVAFPLFFPFPPYKEAHKARQGQ
jgi:hypothetical protein